MFKAYTSCVSVRNNPVRIALHHMAIESDCGEKTTSPVPGMPWKQGITLWADGSPWVATIAASFPYLDTPIVQQAQIPLGCAGYLPQRWVREPFHSAFRAHTINVARCGGALLPTLRIVIIEGLPTSVVSEADGRVAATLRTMAPSPAEYGSLSARDPQDSCGRARMSQPRHGAGSLRDR